jgi:hypothetical protein
MYKERKNKEKHNVSMNSMFQMFHNLHKPNFQKPHTKNLQWGILKIPLRSTILPFKNTQNWSEISKSAKIA